MVNHLLCIPHTPVFSRESGAAKDKRGGGSAASYAIRFAAGFEGVFMVLSGMSDVVQMSDNLSFMKQFKPLSDTERAAIEAVRRVYRGQHLIECTACRYCVAGCPKHISIPDLFACMNAKRVYLDSHADEKYAAAVNGSGKASDCIGCGRCENACPQHLPIRDLLKSVASEFEN